MTIHIDIQTAHQGNRALAWVLLLYFHLLREGGITHDQTVYVNADEFNAFEYIAIEVTQNLQVEINQRLIRRGAVIYLLCELNDMVTDYDDYLVQPFTQKILKSLASESVAEAVPEVMKIVKAVSEPHAALDYPSFQNILQEIFTTYVVGDFKALVAKH